VNDTDGGSPAPPIDRPILEDIRDRLRTSQSFTDADIVLHEGHVRLLAVLDPSYVPATVEEATLDIRWYSNDDFSAHYHETGVEEWACRWGRHPNPHNAREHYHPPPDATTPGEDRSWPGDYRDVMSLVLDRIDRRIEEHWLDLR
jgi:hypothetical protein